MNYFTFNMTEYKGNLKSIQFCSLQSWVASHVYSFKDN